MGALCRETIGKYGYLHALRGCVGQGLYKPTKRYYHDLQNTGNPRRAGRCLPRHRDTGQRYARRPARGDRPQLRSRRTGDGFVLPLGRRVEPGRGDHAVRPFGRRQEYQGDVSFPHRRGAHRDASAAALRLRLHEHPYVLRGGVLHHPAAGWGRIPAGGALLRFYPAIHRQRYGGDRRSGRHRIRRRGLRRRFLRKGR